MYQIMIRGEDGVVHADDETEAIAVAYKLSGGIMATTLIDTDPLTAFDILLTLDMMQERIMHDHPGLRKMYKRRKRLIKGVTSVDIGPLRAILGNRKDDDADE